VLYPDEGLLSAKPKRCCCFYVLALNLILYKHVEVAIKWKWLSNYYTRRAETKNLVYYVGYKASVMSFYLYFRSFRLAPSTHFRSHNNIQHCNFRRASGALLSRNTYQDYMQLELLSHWGSKSQPGTFRQCQSSWAWLRMHPHYSTTPQHNLLAVHLRLDPNNTFLK